MNSEKLCLASKTIDISEHENYIELTNRLCYYDDCNLNNVMLPYKDVEESAKEMAQSLVNMPMQAKYKKIKNMDDLGGHEMSVDSEGNVNFGTVSIGTHTKAWIGEPEDVVTVSGETKKLPCLYAVARVWKRNKNIISAIKRLFASEGGLNSSWEITTSEYEYSNGIKKLTNYEFIGNTCLGSNITPAYKGTSKTISMASEMPDGELLIAEAVSQDILENCAFDINKLNEKEENLLKKDELNLSSEELNENEVENTDAENTPANDEASENPSEDTPAEVSEEEKDDEDDDTDDTTDEVDDEEKDKSETDISKCGGGSDKKKKKASEASETSESETETSQLTDWDLRSRVNKGCREKMECWCWVSFMFPEDHVVWCEYGDAQSELDYLKFTYTVEGDAITVSEPEKVQLTVTPKEINSTVAEYEKQIAEKDETILTVSSEITELRSQVTELSQYKEKFEQAEQEKIEAELAEKKEQLISSVVKSGQITREEIETSEEMKGYVDNLDKKSLMAIVGERLLSSVDEKAQEVETSEEKENVHVSTNLNDTEEKSVVSDAEKASSVRRYLFN